MTGPVLTLDRGNSTLDLKLWESAARRERVSTDQPVRLQAFLGELRPALAVGVTVVEAGLSEVARQLADLGVSLQLVGRDLRVPLEVCYQDPSTLGQDRLVAGLAASLEHSEAVVVDCGTALTINLVRDRQFLGGAIAPGPAAMARGLAVCAPALPQPDLTADFKLPGRSTPDAVNAGTGLGFVSMVDGLVPRVAAAADMAGAPILLTGGRAEYYLGHGRLAVEHVPDLIHRGLRWLARQTA